MSWDSSNRRSRLPRDWENIRRRVFRIKGRKCLAPGCGARATDVDHIRPGDDHSLSNLQPLCSDCHEKKSRTEGAQAKAAEYRRLKALTKRPAEVHPGTVPPDQAKPLPRKGW